MTAQTCSRAPGSDTAAVSSPLLRAGVAEATAASAPALPVQPLPHADRMKRRARDEFDAWARSYDRSLLNVFLFGPSYRAFLQELIPLRERLGRPLRILDIGCGTGTFAAMACASGLADRVVGLDYAPAMCSVAADKARRNGHDGRLRFITGDSEHLPFADGCFDAVTCGNSFHHYPRQAAVVREMRRVLRPGGRLLLVDGFRDNVVGWVVFDVIIAWVERAVHHASWRQVRQYFEQAGLRRIRQRKFNFWMPLLLTVGEA